MLFQSINHIDEDAFNADQDCVERLQNQSETAVGAKTNIANTIKLKCDHDE